MPIYTLTDLNLHIRQTLEETYPEAIWVTAEISSFSINSYSGHCYLELSDGDGQPARAKAMVWKKTFEVLHRKFQIQTGTSLQKGIKIQVLAKVEFNVQYGLSLIIWDIDSDFSLGDISRKRIEVLQKLELEGLSNKNKALKLPAFVQHIAVISSATAAGYQDFTTHLLENQFGFSFSIAFFQVHMQGMEALVSIPAAFAEIAKSAAKFEAVVLIRGGGSAADLQVFDSYEIAKSVANCEIPVFTGIGHERDDSVSDQMANQRFKTPTAVADFLIGKMAETESEVYQLGQKISQNLLQQVQGKIYEFQGLNQVISRSMSGSIQAEGKRFGNLKLALFQAAQTRYFEKKEAFLEVQNQLIQTNPLAILSKGYARVFQNNAIQKTINGIEKNEQLSVQMIDGEMTTKILTIQKK